MAEDILLALARLVGEADEEVEAAEPGVVEVMRLEAVVVDSLPRRSLLLLAGEKDTGEPSGGLSAARRRIPNSMLVIFSPLPFVIVIGKPTPSW